jgi:hypothetical protein
MHLIQLLLPLYDNRKRRFPRSYFNSIRDALTEKFGGVTAFVRSPAVGLWKESQDQISRDDVVMFEVMAGELDRPWWRERRKILEKQFRQDQILIRAIGVEPL